MEFGGGGGGGGGCCPTADGPSHRTCLEGATRPAPPRCYPTQWSRRTASKPPANNPGPLHSEVPTGARKTRVGEVEALDNMYPHGHLLLKNDEQLCLHTLPPIPGQAPLDEVSRHTHNDLLGGRQSPGGIPHQM